MRTSRLAAVLATAMGVFFLSNSANAEVSVTSSARVVTPLTAAATSPLAFGNVAASGSAGTVTVTQAGARSAAGGAALVSGATVSAGAIGITAGEASATVTITTPASATLASGGNNMTVNGFSAPATVALSAGGTGSFNIGGTLQVGASQATGNYAGSFNVTLAYQ